MSQYSFPADRMAEPSRKRTPRREPVIRGPVVILPPSSPGGPPRRFAIQPRKVFALLAGTFLLGVLLSAAVFFWRVSDLRSDYDQLSSEIADLRGELTDLRERTDGVPPATAAGEAPGAEAAAPPAAGPDTDDRPALDLPLDALGGEEPKVRVAVLQTSGEVILKGEGLALIHAQGEPTPMPRGQARIKPAGGGIWIEGVGGVRPGTRIESRLGPIQLDDRSYPGRLEVHRDGDQIVLVNVVSMEEYVAGVVSSEVPAGWGLEAKKAQAVAARSYALMQVATADGGWHLVSDIRDQMYSGKPVDAGSRAAVTATHGKVLAAAGGLASVYYSSTCAGHTEDPATVWPDRSFNGTAMAECGFCDESPNYHWSTVVPSAALLDVLRRQGHRANAIETIQVVRSKASGRVKTVDIVTDKGTVTWSGNELRMTLGSTKVKSTKFELTFDEASDAFTLEGTGFGHGAGLCQYGAQGMDEAGHDYEAILGRYFPAAEIAELW